MHTPKARLGILEFTESVLRIRPYPWQRTTLAHIEAGQRQRGFEAEIKKYPNINYAGFQISNNDPSKAAAEVGSTLAAHPNLAGIFATNHRSAEGAATGLRVADKVGAVKIVGFDEGDTRIKQLKDGLQEPEMQKALYTLKCD